MKTSSITVSDIAKSVWAVPPLALTGDGSINPPENEALIDHMESGGVSTILYGGNANLYSVPAGLYQALIEQSVDWVSDETWLIPSVGPDWGRLMDQADVLKATDFPAAMALPMSGPATPAGVERAYRDFAERAAMPLILYVKSAAMIAPQRLGALLEDGVAIAIKYAIEGDDLSFDPYLTQLLDHAPSDRIVSGIGEIAGVKHLKAFGLAGFTAGAVCIAPRRAMAVLRALQASDYDAADALCEPIQPLEGLRNQYGPIPVIHEAVSQSGIADMGPIQPQLSAVDSGLRSVIRAAVESLLAAEEDLEDERFVGQPDALGDQAVS